MNLLINLIEQVEKINKKTSLSYPLTNEKQIHYILVYSTHSFFFHQIIPTIPFFSLLQLLFSSTLFFMKELLLFLYGWIINQGGASTHNIWKKIIKAKENRRNNKSFFLEQMLLRIFWRRIFLYNRDVWMYWKFIHEWAAKEISLFMLKGSHVEIVDINEAWKMRMKLLSTA